jgi:predicted RNA-binding protein YlqC (UPF0109 family)
MTELVETIAKALVDSPDRVSVTETDDGRDCVLQLVVAGSDMGKVIGKQGRIAKALRTVVKAAALREKKNVTVEIISEEELEEAENVLNTADILDLEIKTHNRKRPDHSYAEAAEDREAEGSDASEAADDPEESVESPAEPDTEE